MEMEMERQLPISSTLVHVPRLCTSKGMRWPRSTALVPPLAAPVLQLVDSGSKPTRSLSSFTHTHARAQTRTTSIKCLANMILSLLLTLNLRSILSNSRSFFSTLHVTRNVYRRAGQVQLTLPLSTAVRDHAGGGVCFDFIFVFHTRETRRGEASDKSSHRLRFFWTPFLLACASRYSLFSFRPSAADSTHDSVYHLEGHKQPSNSHQRCAVQHDSHNLKIHKARHLDPLLLLHGSSSSSICIIQLSACHLFSHFSPSTKPAVGKPETVKDLHWYHRPVHGIAGIDSCAVCGAQNRGEKLTGF